MILSNVDIKKAITRGELVIDPCPEETQYSTSALDLRVGAKFWRFKYSKPGIENIIDYDIVRKTAEAYKNLMDFIESIPPNDDGSILIKPDKFVLMETLEKITLPLKGKLAARVEGRSTLARLGISVHMTAPIIHSDFSGVIYLEVKNEGPFILKIWPRKTRICQVVFERVSSTPRKEPHSIFRDQDKPTGKA